MTECRAPDVYVARWNGSFIYGICCAVFPHLLPFVTFVLTADQNTTVRRVKLITYVLLFARAEYYRFIVVVVESAAGGWCAHPVCADRILRT